jgi:CHAT domain-containing protein/tetratricopeptide (TPR) repeat protein
VKHHWISAALVALAAGGLAGTCARGEVASKTEARAGPPHPPLLLTSWKAGARRLERLRPGQARSYAFHLQADQYLHLVIEQLGLDVIARVHDPSGRLLLEADSPRGGSGSEDLFLVAEGTGRHLLEIATWGSGGGGRYVIRVETLRAATDDDRKRAAAAGAFSRARLFERAKAPREAAMGYQRAAELWRGLSVKAREAHALTELGKLYAKDPARRREGTKALAHALDLYGQLGEEREQALVLFHLGTAWLQLNEVEGAGHCYEQAIALWQKLGDIEEWAARLNDLAIVRVRQGRIHAAIDLYSQAIEVWERVGALASLATTRTNLGLLYASLGESRMALEQYQSALTLLEQFPDPALRAVTLSKLGDVLLRTEGPEAALIRFREALELRKEQRDTRGQAVTLNGIGQAQLEANRPQKALRAFEAAVEIFRQQGEDTSVAVVLNNVGMTSERLGQPGRARDLYRQSLALVDREGFFQQAEEAAIFGLARVARMEGKLDEAERWMEQGLERIETIRGQVWRPDLRASYHGARQEQYAFLIDLLAERHQREPGGGHAARAFAVAERARARSLLDLLSAARHDPHPEELHRFDELERRINDRHQTLLAVTSQGIVSDQLERELVGLLEDLRQAKAAVEGPRLVSRAVPPTLSLQQVQTRLLDEETLLLAYFLGEERSFLWAVTPSTVRFVSNLPGRQQIETAARRTWERMTASHRQTGEVAARQAAARLSEMVLGPVADLLSRRRLVVLAPGALQVVPFSALPHPALDLSASPAEPRLLIVDHEIVSLPSASVLAALRSRIAGRRPPSGFLAVVADPVLDPGDERLRGLRGRLPGIDRRWTFLSRLPFARQEAETILSLAGNRPILSASGFKASRNLVQSGQLRNYRVLHFATHGIYNDLHPELSALALSTFDASGRLIDGHLRAYEVSSLDLRADLVVLSACSTALGSEIGGEGLVGLTHGFLHAGVPRMVVSLWDVDDQATSELMKRFYAGLLLEKLSPGQALRQAQLSLLAEERWRAPYHWAGFVLQGDWQPSFF